MKIVYSSNVPKSRQKAYSPSGRCFYFNWNHIAGIIQEHRLKHKYTDEKEPVIQAYIDDNGITFYTEDLYGVKK